MKFIKSKLFEVIHDRYANLFQFTKKTPRILDQSTLKKSLNNEEKCQLDIFIFGCNPFSACLCTILEKENISVLGFVSKTAGDFFCNKPVYTLQQFSEKEVYQSFPLVIATNHIMSGDLPVIDFESIKQFKISMQEIIYSYHIQNELLHPAALIDFMSVKYPTKLISFGIPGAGNTIFNNICFHLAQSYVDSFSTKNKVSLFFERLCIEYTQCIDQVLLDYVHFMDGYNLHIASWKINSTNAVFHQKDNRVLLYAFPTRNYIISPIYGYHKMPSETYLKKLTLQECKLFFIIRNPLDMILSILNKSSVIDKQTKKIDFHKFCIISQLTITQLNNFHTIISYFHIIRYEDLINESMSVFNKIANLLKFDLKASKARQIYDQLIFKQLPTAPKEHFWSGGIGKWENFFQSEHLSFLKSIGIESVLEKYQYFTVLKKFKDLSANLSEHEWHSNFPNVLKDQVDVSNHPSMGDEYDATLDRLIQYYGKEACLTSGNLHVVCKDESLKEKMNSMVNSQYLNRLASAGMHSQFRETIL